MPDIQEIIDGITKLIELMFGGKPPGWLLPALAWTIAIGLLLNGMLFVLGKIKVLWNEFVWPLFHKPEQQRLLQRKQHFADYVDSEIRRLNLLEAWSDYRFAELEAEIEAEGKTKWLGQFHLPGFSYGGLRLEHSLSRALERSNERLLLLEGDPGSGKSVALRHVAQRMAQAASKSRNLKTVIPIYVNLKEIVRSSGQLVNRDFIENFVLKTLNRINDRDIAEFLEDHFKEGLEQGTWLFLFDSFDEIPEILGSTEADESINLYASAIRDFLHGMNQCRGIVASREYRGPRHLGWPRFRILELSSKRRAKLIKCSGLPTATQKMIVGNLALASPDFRLMSSNPMFLGLLCDFFRDRGDVAFPQNSHIVFESYIQHRLTRDENRLQKRFNLTSNEVRLTAEKFAFCIAAIPSLGLNPTRERLHQATIQLELDIDSDFDSLADALEFLKLARSETMVAAGDSKPFTFAHRRFQEYFATSIVLREPGRITPEELLTNARWRETAIVLLQTQSAEIVQDILQAAYHKLETLSSEMPLLAEYTEDIKTKAFIGKILSSIRESYALMRTAFFELLRLNIVEDVDATLKYPVHWPAGLLHILGILQDGSLSNREIISQELRGVIDRILLFVPENGAGFDLRWGLEVAGAASEATLVKLVEAGFRSGSQWMNDIAYRQVSKLDEVPKSISKHIHEQLTNMALGRELFSKRQETRTHIARLHNAKKYLCTLRLMLLTPLLDHILTIASMLIIFCMPISVFVKAALLTAAFSAAFFLAIRWYAYSYLPSSAQSLFTWVPVPGFVLATSVFVIGIPEGTLADITYSEGAALIATFYCLTWAPMAVFCSSSGILTRPIWWVFYPLIVVIAFVGFLPLAVICVPLFVVMLLFLLIEIAGAVIRKIRNLLGSSRRGLLTLALAIGAVGLVLAVMVRFLGLLLTVTLVVVLLEFLAAVAIAMWLARKLYGVTKDLIKRRNWIRSNPTPLKLSEMLDLLTSYNVPLVQAQILRTVREKQLLSVSPETQQQLISFIVLMESSISTSERKARLALKKVLSELESTNRELVGWLSTSEEKPRNYLAKWSTRQLDELYRLLEQVKQLS